MDEIIEEPKPTEELIGSMSHGFDGETFTFEGAIHPSGPKTVKEIFHLFFGEMYNKISVSPDYKKIELVLEENEKSGVLSFVLKATIHKGRTFKNPIDWLRDEKQSDKKPDEEKKESDSTEKPRNFVM